MSRALYLVKYRGRFEEGGAVLYIGDGIISGVDVGELVYDGTYKQADNGGITGSVTLRARRSSTLVTGATVPAGHSVTIPINLPANFANGAPFSFTVGNATVPTTFEKIRDL